MQNDALKLIELNVKIDIIINDYCDVNFFFLFYLFFPVCCGCLGNKASLDLLAGLLLRLSGSLSHLDTMISRRSKLLLPFKPSFYYRLLAYEMIYLWNSLPAQEGLKSILLGMTFFVAKLSFFYRNK